MQRHCTVGSSIHVVSLLLYPSVQYILNVTREIDNFFPGLFEYHNIRVYDEEATDLLAYWNDTFKFISRAKYVHVSFSLSFCLPILLVSLCLFLTDCISSSQE